MSERADDLARRAQALGLILIETAVPGDDGLPETPPWYRLRATRPEWDDLPDLDAVERIIEGIEQARPTLDD